MIVTFRAFGFGASCVVLSVLVEALVLAVLGATLGVFLAWLFFDGHIGHTQDISFPLAVTPALVRQGVLLAIAIGLIGALLPAIRAASK